MKRISVGTDIQAPVDRVWEVVTDLEGCAERIPAIKRIEFLTPLRTGPGCRWRETRTMFGRDATEDLEITAWHPPREYEVGAENHGCVYRTVIRITDGPLEGTARLEMEFGAEPRTLVARLMGALMLPFLGGAMCRAIAEDLAAIKRACEGAEGSTADEPDEDAGEAGGGE